MPVNYDVFRSEHFATRDTPLATDMNHNFLRVISASRTALLGMVFVTVCCVGKAAEPESIPLWPNGASGSELRMNEPEKIDQGPGKWGACQGL